MSDTSPSVPLSPAPSALAGVGPSELVVVTARAVLVDAARGYAAAARAPATRRAYASDLKTYVAWCALHGFTPLPVAPGVLALYFAARAEAGLSPSKLGRELAAISQVHRAAGLPSPRADGALQEVMKGIRREKGVAVRQMAPLLPQHLRVISERLPANLLGRRDRAPLLLGFAGALRRSELVALDVEDLAFSNEGLELSIRKSKTDQEGEGAKLGIPFGGHRATCPVRSTRDWLEAAGLTSGALFRPVSRHGRMATSRLSDQSVTDVVQRAAVLAGLNPALYSGHSLRAGLATAAAKAGKPTHVILKQTRHPSAAMLGRYIRDAELFRDNAAQGVGL